MDPERIQRAATGRKASDVSRRMNRRMKVYAVGIALILAVLYATRSEQQPVAVELADEPLGPVDVPLGSRTQTLAQVDRTLLAQVRDDTAVARAQIEPEARRHLTRQAGRLVSGDLQALGLQPGDWDELVAGAAERHGDPIWILGTLSWWQRERVDGLTEVRGEVLDSDGRPWAFLALGEPLDIEQGAVVKLAGFYFKAYELLRPDGSLVTAPLIVTEELLRSAYRIAPLTELPSASLADIIDRDLAQASRSLDEPAFYELLSFVNNGEHDDVLPTGEVSEVLPSELLVAPQRWRGAPVSLTGVLYYQAEVPLGPRGENPLGIPFAWNLWVSDNRAGEAGTILCVVLEKPEGVAERQIVTIEGRFYRRLAFENRANHPRLAAVVLAREVRPFVPAEDTLTPLLLNVILGLMGVVGAALILGQWRERRALVLARHQRMRRHRDNVARPGLLSPAPVTSCGGAVEDCSVSAADGPQRPGAGTARHVDEPGPSTGDPG